MSFLDDTLGPLSPTKILGGAVDEVGGAIKEVGRAGRNIEKGTKNIIGGVGKEFQRAFKEVERFSHSDLGKIAIAAAVVYFGGMAISSMSEGGAAVGSTALTESTIPVAGMEGGSALTAADFASADFAASGAGMAEGAGAAVTSADFAGAATLNAPGVTPTIPNQVVSDPTLLASSNAPSAGPIGGGVKSGSSVLEASTPTASTGMPLQPGQTPINGYTPIDYTSGSQQGLSSLGGAGGNNLEGSGGGLISKAKNGASWMQRNPIPTIMGAQVLQSLVPPPELPNQALELEKYRRENSTIAGVGYGGGGTPLGAATHSNGSPTREGVRSALRSDLKSSTRRY